uniref:Uncharacterized protein n=1 Tax=Acrobeloides nanus TaxID=290746 RepID=A0A914DI08_9BILA
MIFKFRYSYSHKGTVIKYGTIKSRKQRTSYTEAGMSYAFSIGCLLLAFALPFGFFVTNIANDPLRIILFILGAFFWLMSLLFSAIFWYAVVPLRNTLVFSLVVSVLLQELVRFAYFLLLRRAQTGLSRLSSNGIQISGIHSLHRARHMLAVVCGLGMGVMASLFLLVNVLADSAQDGKVGLPATIPQLAEKFDVKLYVKDAYFPLYYTINCAILVLFHVCWTIQLWDGCHRKVNGLSKFWWIGLSLPIVSHYLNMFISFLNGSDQQYVAITLQILLLSINLIYCYAIVRLPTLPGLLNFIIASSPDNRTSSTRTEETAASTRRVLLANNDDGQVDVRPIAAVSNSIVT